MAENESPHPVDLGHPEPHAEVSDVNAWAIGKFAIALVLVSIISLAGLFALFRYFIQSTGGQEPPVTRNFEINAEKRPPAPQLEVSERLDLARERAAEDKLLTTYGWADRQSNTARIPIDRAIDLVAQQGLPSRPEAPRPASTATVPTASGMGEIMQQPGGPLGGGGK
ncbi:MAG TPA: hypothetical protein VLW65_21390 [Bryobacteraceae bacterium]|nr:hypothetical protein [Bryobacteraceae bacterium]